MSPDRRREHSAELGGPVKATLTNQLAFPLNRIVGLRGGKGTHEALVVLRKKRDGVSFGGSARGLSAHKPASGTVVVIAEDEVRPNEHVRLTKVAAPGCCTEPIVACLGGAGHR